MSNAVSALNSAVEVTDQVRIEDAGLIGMITLRGDLSDPSLGKAATEASGVAVPVQGQAQIEDGFGMCWMSPDELLILCPYADVQTRLSKLNVALKGRHALAVDVSDARATFRVSGAGARDVMAKLAPVDLRPQAFGPTTFRRTRMAQVAAAFFMPAPDTFQIICFRSNAQYMFDLLKVAARGGADVGYF